VTSPVFVDAYALDDGGHLDIDALVAAGLPWAGIGLKATEGLYYPKDPSWFHSYWPKARSAAGARYGQTFFRFAYHYFRTDEDAVKQADFALGLVDSAGGWAEGDLRLVVDVESAEQPVGVMAQQVIDGVSAFAERVKTRHGQAPILYAGSYLRDLKITDHMGCAYLITAAYGATLPASLYESMGWDLAELLGWQYCSTDAYTGPANYPRQCPLGPGPLDLTALTIANGSTPEQQLAWLQGDIAHGA